MKFTKVILTLFIALIVFGPAPIFAQENSALGIGSAVCLCKLDGVPCEGGNLPLTPIAIQSKNADATTICQKACVSAGKESACSAKIVFDSQDTIDKNNLKAGICPPGKTCLTNPLGTENVSELIGNIIKAVLGFTGAVALLMFIYGGLLWLTSAGSADKIEKGRQVMVWATIGLVIIFSSYGLVRFVFGVFTKI